MVPSGLEILNLDTSGSFERPSVGDSGGAVFLDDGTFPSLIGVLRLSDQARRISFFDGASFVVPSTCCPPSPPCDLKYNATCPLCMENEVFVLPEYPVCSGDADFDNDVDIMDQNVVLGNFQTSCAPGSPVYGDVDYDGDVDLADLNTVLGNFGTTCVGGGMMFPHACGEEEAAGGEMPGAEGGIAGNPMEPVLAELGWFSEHEYTEWVQALDKPSREEHAIELLVAYWTVYGTPTE